MKIKSKAKRVPRYIYLYCRIDNLDVRTTVISITDGMMFSLSPFGVIENVELVVYERWRDTCFYYPIKECVDYIVREHERYTMSDSERPYKYDLQGEGRVGTKGTTQPPEQQFIPAGLTPSDLREIQVTGRLPPIDQKGYYFYGENGTVYDPEEGEDIYTDYSMIVHGPLEDYNKDKLLMISHKEFEAYHPIEFQTIEVKCIYKSTS
jgi:hypothetical protein